MASSVQWVKSGEWDIVVPDMKISPHVLSLLSPHTSLHVHNIVHTISPLYPPGDSKQFSGRPRSASVPGPGAMGTRYSDILVQWHICNMLTYIPLQISQIQQSQPWLPGRNIILRSLNNDKKEMTLKVRMVSSDLPSSVRIVEVHSTLTVSDLLCLLHFTWPLTGWTERWVAEWEDCRAHQCQSWIYFQADRSRTNTCGGWSSEIVLFDLSHQFCSGHSFCQSQVGASNGWP